MKRRFSDKPRGSVSRKRKPVMFISLEGNNKTEKYYLISLNKDHGDIYSLQFVPGHDTDLQGMWQNLHALMSESFSSIDGDKAYCVCDRDYEAYKLDRIREIKRDARHDQAKLIVSNPCFELWFLNHFRYSTRSYGSYREMKSDLCEHIPCYEKNLDYYQSHLKSRTLEAIANSIRQIENASGDQLPFDFVPDNPGTEVAELVQTIIAN
jgi:hypothetical protein